MLYTIYTQRGLGVQIWGTYDDLRTLYEVISRFWNISEFEHIEAFENRNQLISSFSYEVQKGMEGSRLAKKGSHFSEEENQYYGFEVSWVHVLFSIVALKENWKLIPPDKLDLAYFYTLEYWIESGLDGFDSITGAKVKPYLNGGIYAANPLLYQFMRQLNLEFFQLGGGKNAFKKLPELLKASIYLTPEFEDLNKSLQKEAVKLGVKPRHLDFNEENSIYKIKW